MSAMAAEREPPREIPEHVFRRSAAYRDLAEIKAAQRLQSRAEFRARWPLSRLAKVAAIYLGPVLLLVGGYWIGRGWGGN